MPRTEWTVDLAKAAAIRHKLDCHADLVAALEAIVTSLAPRDSSHPLWVTARAALAKVHDAKAKEG